MVETIFPPASNWYISKIISSREDGSVAYGSQNSVFMMKIIDGKIKPLLILNAHKERVTSVIFSPTNHFHQCQDLLVSSSDDGFVKLWNIGSQIPLVAHNSHSIGTQNVKVVCASWSPCNHQYIVSAGENDTLVLWNIIANKTIRFVFSKLQPAVIECSYHDERVVAVGCKNGLVYIIRLVGKGEKIHKLRGHNKEVQGLSWNPIPFDNEMSNHSKCLLATSSQEKEIYIWQGDEGQCVARIQLPKTAFVKRNFHNGKSEPTLNFTPIFWSSPNRLYAVDKFGELICCDPLSVIQTETQNVAHKDSRRKVDAEIWKLVHALHSHTVFAISGVPIKIEALNSEATDSAGSARNFSTLQIDRNQSHLLNNPPSDSSSNHSSDSGTVNQEFDTPRLPNPGLIWTVGRDQKLIAIKKEDSTGEPEFCLSTINGNPYIIRESPHDPSFVGIGVGDGKIRLWNVSRSSGQARTFSFKLNDRVYSLAWHPLKESFLAFGTAEGKIGIIDVYSQKPPVIFPAKHSGKVYCLSWGPTFFEEGQRILPDKKRLSLYSVGGHKILWHSPNLLTSETLRVQTNVPCKKFVDLRWKADYSVLAVGSRKGYIYILRPPLFDVICLVLAASKCIMSLTWHPRSTDLSGLEHTGFDSYLTFASIDKDRVIKVYNYTEEPDSYNIQVVSVLRGHNKPVQFVSWNPHVSGQIISSSSDYTVRIWDVRTSTQLLQIRASEGVLPLCCFWDPIDPNVIIAGFSERVLLTWKISKSDEVEPTLKVITLDRGIKFNIGELMHEPDNLPGRNSYATFEETVEEVDQPIESETNNLTQTDESDSDEPENELKMIVDDSFSETVAFQNYCELLRTPKEDLLQISFFESESELSAFLELEDDDFPRQSIEHRRCQIAQWTGNLRNILEERVAKGEVDDYLIALAPCVSTELWREACECYVQKLIERRHYRKAATYLLNIDKIHEAVAMLVKMNLFSEAICIARCRLPTSDPTFANTLRKYAQLLELRKQLLKSAECHLVLQDYAEAARILARKDNAEHLSLAAATAQKGGFRDLEASYSHRALILSLETQKFNLATQIAKDHPEIKVLTLLSETCQLLYKLDNGMANLEKDIITYIREITGIEKNANVYASLKHMYVEKKIPLRKKIMYVMLAFELSFACCATETDIFLTHIIRAMETTTKPLVKDTDGVPRVFKLSLWLCPAATTDYLSRDTIFGWDDVNIRPKIISLRAYFCLGIADLMSNVLHHKIPPVGNMTEYSILLEKLINDALDKDAITYYRNQVDIKSVYTTIDEAHKRKRERKDSENSGGEATNKNVPECLAKYLKDALELDSAEVSEDDIIASETEKITRMTEQMKNFEASRISSPDPSNIYAKLWEVLEAIEKTEILNKIEKKLEELDWHDKF